MSDNASLLHEYQIASMAALAPEIHLAYPEVGSYLSYPEARALWAAVGKIRALSAAGGASKTDDPLLLASLMAEAGYQTSPEFVRDNMLTVARTWPSESVEPVIGYLKQLYQRRDQASFLTQLQADVKNGKLTFAEAETQFSARRALTEGVDQNYILLAEDAANFGALTAAQRKLMDERGKNPKLPRLLDKMRREIDLELDTMLLITGKTGAGKTVLTEQIGEELALNGEHVFYVCTELTKKQMIWRRLARKFGIPYQRLKHGYWDADLFGPELGPNENGGRIDYFEAGGVPLDQIIDEARRRKAHLIIDYWDMVTLGAIAAFGGMKGLSLNKGDLIGAGLTMCKAYAQHEKRLVVIVQQHGKNQELGPIDSARFAHRANLWIEIVLDEAKKNEVKYHPWTDDDGKAIEVPILKGHLDPFGYLKISKDTFGGEAGARYYVYLEGSRYRFLSADTLIAGKIADEDDGQVEIISNWASTQGDAADGSDTF